MSKQIGRTESIEALRNQYLFEDSFLTNDLTAWTVILPPWTWQPVTRDIRAAGAGIKRIRTNIATLTDIYATEARIITVVAGAAIHEVGGLYAKWIDIDNNIGFSLMTDGRARLWWNKGGVYNRILIATGLSHLNWHTFRVEIRGTNALGFIDGVLYCNANHADISQGAGYPGLEAEDAVTSDFDDFKVWGIRE